MADDDDLGFSGESGIDDLYANEAAGKGSASDSEAWGAQAARRAAAQETAKNAEGAAEGGASAGLSGERGKGISAAKNAEGGAAGFVSNVTGKGEGRGGVPKIPTTKAGAAKFAAERLKKFGPFGIILGVIVAIVMMFSASQSLAPFGLVANGLDQFNSLRTSMNLSTKKYGLRSFHAAYNKASKSDRLLKGHIAGWFDSSSKALHNIRLRFTRNVYEGTNKDMEEDANIRRSAKQSGLDQGIDDVVDETKEDTGKGTDGEEIAGGEKQKQIGYGEVEERDSNGNVYKKAKETPEGVPDNEAAGIRKSLDDSVDVDVDEQAISDNFKARATSVIAGLKQGVGLYCGVVKAVQAISLVISAMHVASVLNYVTTFLNAIQQAQAGDGGAALHYFMNSISQKGTTLDIDGNTVSSGKSSLESDAWNQFFSDGSVVLSADDPVAFKFNKDYAMTSGIRGTLYSDTAANTEDNTDEPKFRVVKALIDIIIGIVSGTNSKRYHEDERYKTKTLYSSREFVSEITDPSATVELYKTCVEMQVASDLVSAGAQIVAALLPGGAVVATGAKQISKAIYHLVYSTTISFVVKGIIQAVGNTLIPKVAKWFAMDLIKNMAGEDAAYAINSGFNMYLGKQMQQSSGIAGTKNQVLAQWRETQTVIAEEAEYQRSIRSPFDPTSKYTFLGSIVNSLTPLANSLSSPLSVVSNTTALVGSSIASLSPTAFADGEARFETSLKTDCPGLEDIEGMEGGQLVADAFCNPYFVTETKTLKSSDPYASRGEVEDQLDGTTTTKDGATIDKIKKDSELAKWVLACTQRETQFGLADSNVANAMTTLIQTGDSTVDNIIDIGLSSVPYVEDIYDFYQDLSEKNNLDWTTGQNCFTEDAAKFSRYSEDQRWLESAGEIEQSSVAAFLDEYYEENPVDNSTEGVIARYSGLTKETVKDTLALMEYATYLANYDPTGAGPMVWDEEKPQYIYETDTIIAESEPVILGKYVIYDSININTTV